MFINAAVERLFEKLMKLLAELDVMIKELQRDHATVRCTRAYFDTVLEDYPKVSDIIDVNSQTFRDPHHESENFKIQNGQGGLLCITEKI